MKTRAIILAGGEGSRLGVLTAKRTKPAVPFAGKYRIIDFTLSNCVNSNIFDIMILAQYRPHSLIGHIGAGGPWDLNREFTGGVRIYTPYKARRPTNWYSGTADAVQQNFSFIKGTNPDLVLILSGDHIYEMNYDALIEFHFDHQADLTMATKPVLIEDASRFGIVGVEDNYRVSSFIEKPSKPPSNLANMGVYLFNLQVLDKALWEDYNSPNSSHDFGKDILPNLIKQKKRVFAFPFTGYWMDVGTIKSYWQAQMDLLKTPPSLDLYDRSWVIHTRTEERPPVRFEKDITLINSMVSDGCVIESGAKVTRCILSPGVRIKANAVVNESILLTDVIINQGAQVTRTIIDKRAVIGKHARIGGIDIDNKLVAIGKNSHIPDHLIVEPGVVIQNDVVPTNFHSDRIITGETIKRTQQDHYEI
ncbi:MAG TPA: glucose-1-phosphate adenylyltransferase [Anaerolineae bacterium]|nr:glucose-1-phosphate adenylyltransferase [Anaerolineae bacterium]